MIQLSKIYVATVKSIDYLVDRNKSINFDAYVTRNFKELCNWNSQLSAIGATEDLVLATFKKNQISMCGAIIAEEVEYKSHLVDVLEFMLLITVYDMQTGLVSASYTRKIFLA